MDTEPGEQARPRIEQPGADSEAMPSTADAVAASIACGRAVGLTVERPEVIAEGYSVRVRLHPEPVVTRVVTLGRALRGTPRAWLEREVAVARFLAASEVGVTAPWRDAGPHHVAGIDVSLWQWVEQDQSTVTDADFGRSLGRLHAALATYPDDLPLLAGPLADIAAAMSRSDDQFLHRAVAVLVPLAEGWPRRPLHGDAHTGNVLMTADGPRWTDFEDVCVGPVEWDLASLTVTEEALSAYPGRLDIVRLEECRDLRRLQILAQLLVGDFDEPALEEEIRTRLRRRL
ncbi:phosphotransferase enzyme family protein [Nocardioides koreensis]